MGNPVFKFTLTHATFGSMVISEPDGWKDAKLKLERHPDFHSLVEYFEGDFIFYGENNYDNGGADFIRQVENIYGLDAEIQILIQADIEGDGTYEVTIFEGQLDLTGLQELKDNKIQVPIIRTDFWAKFIARKDTPVNLRSTTDLDNNSATVIDFVDIDLTSQTIEKRHYGEFDSPAEFDVVAGGYIQFTPDNIIIDELDDFFGIYTAFNAAVPAAFFTAKEAGSYAFDIRVVISGDINDGAGHNPQNAFTVLGDTLWKLYFQINDQTPIKFDYSDVEFSVPLYAGNGWTVYTFTGTYNLNVGDSITVYGDEQANVRTALTFWTTQGAEYRVFGGGGTNALYGAYPHGYEVPSYFRITAQTTFPQTSGQGFLIHDAANAITDRIVGQANSFYSSYFGSTLTNGRSYASNGCGWKNILIQGLQLRGYQLTEKQISMSFMRWWKGADPIFNLGLGYDTVSSTEVIRVENKSHFFDPSISVNISYVSNISREYDSTKIFNRIEVGYSKWESEDISGLDDAQTKRVWATRIQKINNPLTIHSEYVAASTATEVTRRQTIEQSKDYKYDNDIFIIAINGDDVSPDRYTPELDENFNSITGLKNSDTRYNSIHTPLRMLLRWANVWNGCLQKYQSSSLKFVSGEGNYDMSSDYSCSTGDQCLAVICDNLSEKQDIPLGTPANYGSLLGFIHYPVLYTIEIINFTWDEYETIRGNRHKAIGISVTGSNHLRFFIKELTYDVCKGKCKIVAWPFDGAAAGLMTYYNETYVQSGTGSQIPERDYEPVFVEDCGDRVRLLEDGEERITEAGECRNLEDGGTNFFYTESESIEFYIYQESETTETYFYQISEL